MHASHKNKNNKYMYIDHAICRFPASVRNRWGIYQKWAWFFFWKPPLKISRSATAPESAANRSRALSVTSIKIKFLIPSLLLLLFNHKFPIWNMRFPSFSATRDFHFSFLFIRSSAGEYPLEGGVDLYATSAR